jgi:amino acid permease
MRKETLFSVSLLAGTIIGAGIFSLPYVVSRVGLIYGFFYLVAFALVYFCIHLMYAEVSEKHPGRHQFLYLAEQHFSKPLAEAISFVVLCEFLFVLTVYLILAPSFFELAFGWGGIGAMLVFWFLSSAFMFVKLKWLGLAEFLGSIAIVMIVGLIFFAGGTRPLSTPLFGTMNLPLFFLPFGPLLFSLSGRPAISKLVEEYHRARSNDHGGATLPSLKKLIWWGTVLPAVVYVLFVVGVLRLNPAVSPDALSGLAMLPHALRSLVGILGLLALWTSYFMIGLNVKDMLRLDVKWSSLSAGVLAVAAPLLLYFAGLREFFGAITFTGSVFLALEGIFVVVLWRKTFQRSSWRFVSWPILAVFSVALAYEIIKSFS